MQTYPATRVGRAVSVFSLSFIFIFSVFPSHFSRVMYFPSPGFLHSGAFGQRAPTQCTPVQKHALEHVTTHERYTKRNVGAHREEHKKKFPSYIRRRPISTIFLQILHKRSMIIHDVTTSCEHTQSARSQ